MEQIFVPSYHVMSSFACMEYNQVAECSAETKGKHKNNILKIISSLKLFSLLFLPTRRVHQ